MSRSVAISISKLAMKVITSGFRFLVGMSLAFGLIWTSAALGDNEVTFADAVQIEFSDSPWFVAIGDLNDDHVLDLTVAISHDNHVSVLLGLGDGTFAAERHYYVGQSPVYVAIGDLNGDQVPDMAVATRASDKVYVWLGVGDGTFAQRFIYATDRAPSSVAIGDLNGDEVPDLAVGCDVFGTVSVLLGIGDGTFGTAVHYPAGGSVVLGDLNNDQVPDLAAGWGGNVAVLLGVGDGTFDPAVYYAAGDEITSTAIGDLDGDGVLDLGVANNSTDGISVLMGVGNGEFAAAVNYGAGDGPCSIAIGDLNDDQMPDLAVANESSDNVSVLLGVGDGTFVAAVHFDTARFPTAVAIGDLDGDQMPDLAVANRFGVWVSVLFNLSRDCDGNGRPDKCEIDCGSPGGPCDLPGCGAGDENDNGMVDDCEAVSPLPADLFHNRLKNRYISFQPNNAGHQAKLQVTLSDSLPHPGLIGSSWWVLPPEVTVPGAFPKPLVGPSECVAILGQEEAGAEIDWDAEGCQTLHVTGCAIEPTSEYEIHAVAGITIATGPTVPTGLRPTDGKWWGDVVGFFDGFEWTAPQGMMNIDDAVVAIKTFQGGQVVGPVLGSPIAHLSVADVEPGNINTVVNFADVLILIRAFQGEVYPFGPATADGNCP